MRIAVTFTCSYCGHQWAGTWQPRTAQDRPWFVACPQCHLEYGYAGSDDNPALAAYYDAQEETAHGSRD